MLQTNKKPVTEYQLIREKAASQKRDVERALTRFIAKTGDTEKLFEDDPYAFPRESPSFSVPYVPLSLTGFLNFLLIQSLAHPSH